MTGENDRQDPDAVVIKTAMTPEQLAEYMGAGSGVEWVSNDATDIHVMFMARADFDADYRRRFDDLCERLEEVKAHIANGDISKEAEASVAWCLQWAMDQMELMRIEQQKLVRWLMDANAEVGQLRNRVKGSKGGRVAAAPLHDVRAYALGLAKEREPAGGWKSAPEAVRAIMADVEAYARTKGRRYASRKVEEWLRDAGIKRPKTT